MPTVAYCRPLEGDVSLWAFVHVLNLSSAWFWITNVRCIACSLQIIIWSGTVIGMLFHVRSYLMLKRKRWADSNAVALHVKGLYRWDEHHQTVVFCLYHVRMKQSLWSKKKKQCYVNEASRMSGKYDCERKKSEFTVANSLLAVDWCFPDPV